MNSNKKNDFELIKNIPNLEKYNNNKNVKNSNWFNSLLMFFILVFFVILGILITFLVS